MKIAVSTVLTVLTGNSNVVTMVQWKWQQCSRPEHTIMSGWFPSGGKIVSCAHTFRKYKTISVTSPNRMMTITVSKLYVQFEVSSLLSPRKEKY